MFCATLVIKHRSVLAWILYEELLEMQRSGMDAYSCPSSLFSQPELGMLK